MTAPHSYDELCEMARALGRPQGTLTVLSHGADPFGVGTPAHVRDAEWFAELWRQHMPESGGHLRRFHYKLVVLSSVAPIALPHGGFYENTINCWSTLKKAGKWARYLELIDADVIEDRRSPAPVIHLRDSFIDLPRVEIYEPSWYEAALVLGAPELPDLPALSLRRPDYPLFVAQPYHQEILVEKSDVEDICLPIARRFGLNYQQFIGQAGLRPCRELVRRVERSGRPCRIHYIYDFDPQGESMPLAVSRKIQWALRKEGLDLDIQLIPLALTKEQCSDLQLPRAPIKENDRGKGRFEERHGEGATELDALEALHPGLLERMLADAVGRYHDDTLHKRTIEAFDAAFQRLSDEVDALNESVVPRFDDDLAVLRSGLEAIEEALEPIRRQLEPIIEQAAVWRREVEQVYHRIAADLAAAAPAFGDDIEWPEAEEADEHSDPLFDSTRSYLDQIEVYKRHQDKPTERRERQKGVPWSAARRAAAAKRKPTPPVKPGGTTQAERRGRTMSATELRHAAGKSRKPWAFPCCGTCLNYSTGTTLHHPREGLAHV